MWTRNGQQHNTLSNDAKLHAARAYWIESMSPCFQGIPGMFGINDLMRDVLDGKYDALVREGVRTLDTATKVSNATQALMYLRGHNASFDQKNPFESTRYFAVGGSSWTHGYLMRHSSYTRETETSRRHLGAHKTKSRFTYDEDGEIICGDPRGHSWAVSDENENVCYCSRCGCAEY